MSTSVWIKKLTRLVYMNVCVRMPMPRCVLLLNVERHCDSRESKANSLKSMQRCTKPEWNKSPNICHDIIFNRSHNNYGLYELFWWIRLQIFPFSQKKNSDEKKMLMKKTSVAWSQLACVFSNYIDWQIGCFKNFKIKHRF